MKLLVTLCFILVSFFAEAQNAPTITFKDDKTYTVKGNLVSEYNELSEGKPRKNIKVYYERKGNTITVSFLKNWVVEKKLDELKVYTFDANTINADSFGEVEAQEDTDIETGKYFSLSFSAVDGKDFGYDTYSIWESKPEKRSFSTFSVTALTKEALEKMVADIKTVLPKKAEE